MTTSSYRPLAHQRSSSFKDTMAVLKSTTKSKPVEVVKRPNPAGAAIRRGEITISAPIPIVDDRDGEFPIRSHAPAHVLRKEPSQSQLRQSYDDKHRRIP